MPSKIYGIKEFPSDSAYWRVLGFGGVKRSPVVQSEPVIQVLLSALPEGQTELAYDTFGKRTPVAGAWIGVGQLPYVSIGSLWHRQRPTGNRYFEDAVVEFPIDTSKVRIVSLSNLFKNGNIIPHSHYLFGDHFSSSADSLFAAVEMAGDPWALLIPTIEIIRFYYASSTRLAQAFFWGDYEKSLNLEKCGRLENGLYKVHLRKHIPDSDAWTLARFHASSVMQEQVNRVYRDIQSYHVKSHGVDAGPFRAFHCGFPFQGPTSIKAVVVRLPGADEGARRALVLKLVSCSAAFPFGDLVCDRDNKNFKGKLQSSEELVAAWGKRIEVEDKNEPESEVPEESDKTVLNSDSEPLKGVEPLVIDIQENRFGDLAGKELIKEQTEVQRYRNEKPVLVRGPVLTGLGTGMGVWSGVTNRPAEIVITNPGEVQQVPATLDTFFEAIYLLAEDPRQTVRFVAGMGEGLITSVDAVTLSFPTERPSRRRKAIRWARVPTAEGFRPRQVAVVEVVADGKIAYVLECERIRQKDNTAVLVIRKNDYSPMNGSDLHSFLLVSAIRGHWVSESAHKDFRRERTTHNRLTSVKVLSERIGAKLRELYRVTDAQEDQPSEAPGKAPTPAPESYVGEFGEFCDT